MEYNFPPIDFLSGIYFFYYSCIKFLNEGGFINIYIVWLHWFLYLYSPRLVINNFLKEHWLHCSLYCQWFVNFKSTGIGKAGVDALNKRMDVYSKITPKRRVQIASIFFVLVFQRVTVNHKSIWSRYDMLGVRSTCFTFILMRFIFACRQTGSVKWITRLIDTVWTAWILTVFSIRFFTRYKTT